MKSNFTQENNFFMYVVTGLIYRAIKTFFKIKKEERQKERKQERKRSWKKRAKTDKQGRGNIKKVKNRE